LKKYPAKMSTEDEVFMVSKQIAPTIHSIYLFHGVFWVVLFLLILLVIGLFVWRRHLLRIFSATSFLIMLFVAVVIPATWNNAVIITVGANLPQSNGDLLQRTVSISANRGGIEFSIRKYRTITANTLPRDYNSRRNDPPSLIWHVVQNSSQYPQISPKISFTKDLKFLEDKIGILFGCRRGPVLGMNGNLLFILVLIVPQWVPMILCTFAPFMLVRRKLRRRYRLKNLLCLNCGFDLRAHKPGDKCPSCGTPVPERPAQPASDPKPAEPPSPAQTPPA
jgi:hypothetical protein